MSATRTDWEPGYGKHFFASLNGAVAVYGTPPPGAPTLALQSGGTIPTSTACNYSVVALDAAGSSLPSPQAAAAVTTTGGNQKVQITWNLVPGAQQYAIYGRTAGSQLLIATVTATAYTVGGTQSYVDTGAITPSGAAPTTTTCGRDSRIVYEIIFRNPSASTSLDVALYECGTQIGSCRVTVNNGQGSWPVTGTESGIAIENLSISTSEAADVTVITNVPTPVT